ncbi:hypothetical protein Adt_46123 [Abeliophyllum distichum]|uniref:Uncharacterized protein n=1 Tax=Abeliophyllum distichum TaxID=126358 RepID=A0ABD1P2A7_9LAMI
MFTVPPCYPSWTEVLEEQRARLRSIIESYFDLQGDRSPDECRTVCAAVDHLAADRYQDYKLKERFTKNKVKRGKAKYPSVRGSKCFSAMHYDEVQDKLVELRETQQAQVTSNGTSLDERAIVKEVLGERRGHIRGVEGVPKGTSPSLDSTTTSKETLRRPSE